MWYVFSIVFYLAAFFKEKQKYTPVEGEGNGNVLKLNEK